MQLANVRALPKHSVLQNLAFFNSSGSLVRFVATACKALNSRSFDLVSGFAFFVEVAAVDVVYDHNGEVFHLQATDSLFNKNLIIPPHVMVSLTTF